MIAVRNPSVFPVSIAILQLFRTPIPISSKLVVESDSSSTVVVFVTPSGVTCWESVWVVILERVCCVVVC